MSELEEKMQKLVAENLPQQTANEMQKFIREATMNREQVKNQNAVIVDLNERLAESEKKVLELKRQIQHHDDIKQLELDLAEKTADIAKREGQLELTLTKTKHDMLLENTNRIYTLVDRVFGHPGVKVVTTENGDFPNDGGGSYYGSRTKTETTTEEKQ